MIKNIIFLDIDGVLNNREHGCMLFECPPEDYKLDEDNLHNLDYILHNCPNTKIVLSTSWRNYSYDKEFQNAKGWSYKGHLKEVEDRYVDYIIDKAPHKESRNKAGDIAEWLIVNQYNGKYIILDDDPMQGLSYFNPQWIKTSKQYGLTKEFADIIINYFNNNMLEITNG